MSSVNVSSGQVVCPSIHVEFICFGINVSFIEWQINGVELQPNFDIGDSAPMEVTNGLYTLYLDAISVNSLERVANMTTRFRANISNLGSGDQLSCAANGGINSSSILDYLIRGKQDLVQYRDARTSMAGLTLAIILGLPHTKCFRRPCIHNICCEQGLQCSFNFSKILKLTCVLCRSTTHSAWHRHLSRGD